MIPERVEKASKDMLDREKSMVTGRRRRDYKKKEDYEPNFDIDDPADVSEEEFAELDGEIRKSDKPKRNINKKTLAIVVAASIAAGAVGSYFGYKGILNKQDYNRAASLTRGYKVNSVCILPSRVFTTQNHDYNYTTGEHLIEAAKNQKVQIIKIGDIFVTPNGEQVVKLQEEIERRYYKPLQSYEVDGQMFLSEPEGYTYDANNQSCVRVETEIVELYTYATESMHDVEWGTAPYPNSRVKQVLSYEKYDSITYEEAKKMHLIVDVDDEHAYSDGTYANEAQLKLVPNNQK